MTFEDIIFEFWREMFECDLFCSCKHFSNIIKIYFSIWLIGIASASEGQTSEIITAAIDIDFIEQLNFFNIILEKL